MAAQRLTERERTVLDRVMFIDVQIAAAAPHPGAPTDRGNEGEPVDLVALAEQGKTHETP